MFTPDLPTETVFDFSSNTNISSWIIIDDGVMGGKSQGKMQLTEEGHGMFYGKVSTENNGGFSSVRFRNKTFSTENFSKIVIRLKGDKKNYQFRIKAKSRDYHSYIMPFRTNGDWQSVEIELDKMYPGFRGRKLDMTNFNHNRFEEIAFLVGNKKNENFKLIIDKIELR